jgi:hypothetical protein
MRGEPHILRCSAAAALDPPRKPPHLRRPRAQWRVRRTRLEGVHVAVHAGHQQLQRPARPRGGSVVLIDECPLNARLETGVGLSFFLPCVGATLLAPHDALRPRLCPCGRALHAAATPHERQQQSSACAVRPATGPPAAPPLPPRTRPHPGHRPARRRTPSRPGPPRRHTPAPRRSRLVLFRFLYLFLYLFLSRHSRTHGKRRASAPCTARTAVAQEQGPMPRRPCPPAAPAAPDMRRWPYFLSAPTPPHLQPIYDVQEAVEGGHQHLQPRALHQLRQRGLRLHAAARPEGPVGDVGTCTRHTEGEGGAGLRGEG